MAREDFTDLPRAGSSALTQELESSVLNNTMLVQIAVLAWWFLGQALTPREIAGMVLSGLGR